MGAAHKHISTEEKAANPVIFIIDDAEWHNVLLKSILRKQGYHRVRSFTDARLLLNTVKNIRPDIIISDIQMPVMDGFRLYRELRKEPLNKKIDFIFLSSLPVNRVKSRVSRWGIRACLSKPLNPPKLYKLIESWKNRNIPDVTRVPA